MPDKRKSARHAISMAPIDSPFSGFLENDRVPALQERRIIQELLAEKIALLAQLNSRVPRRHSGKKMPRQLRVKLEHTRRFIKYHQALISPWRRLPVEIMSEIFLSTLVDTGYEEIDAYWDDDREGTLLVCKICKTWREIAISTPALWNVLSLSLHSAPRPLDWISTWLERSRSFPVYLQVFWGDTSLPDVINAVIALFASHLNHAAAYSVNGLDIDDPELVNESYPLATFPPVQSPTYAPILSTVGADLPPRSDWDWIRAACRASPRLSSLTTSRSALDWFPATNNAITKLHFIDPVPMSTLLQVLENAPGLQDISVDIEGPSVISSTGDVLVMNWVSRLEVTSSEVFGDFLNQVALPHLVDLSIHQIVVWPEAEFLSFLSRSSCALRNLEFYDAEISEHQLIACLKQKACGMLEDLVVSECIPPLGALLEHLTYRDDQLPNPQLKAIDLGNVIANDGLLAAFAESRVRPIGELPSGVPVPGRLEKLRISFLEGRMAAVEDTHTTDWVRLLELAKAWPEFELEWPEPDE
ncbi:hypothetical protein B0H17DRAFT_1055382 [Mycena rosella]|uniref:F-box domain-containing protein n=1 Tax=Mycena rosella TaxID=1033263 RepID=A0AAD7GI02_MYCRO|nr:hypothetical protein B0H17DRAFT_1055382 [Mycena rosella]